MESKSCLAISMGSAALNDTMKRNGKQKKKETIIRDQKVRGAEHVNHVGHYVAAKCIGPDCKCKRLRCFTVVSQENREKIFKHFYGMKSKDLQDSYLAGLIYIEKIKQRRSRKVNIKKDNIKKEQLDGYDSLAYPGSSSDSEHHKGSHSASVFYKVRFQNQKGMLVDVPVCRAAFSSIHGITPARIRRIYNSLITTGLIPVDCRGKFKNHPKVFPEQIKDLIRSHICSFTVKSVPNNNSRRTYLSETLSIKKLYKMFLNEYQIHISYRDYANIFNKDFNIRFGKARSRSKRRSRISRNSRNTTATANNNEEMDSVPLQEVRTELI